MSKIIKIAYRCDLCGSGCEGGGENHLPIDWFTVVVQPFVSEAPYFEEEPTGEKQEKHICFNCYRAVANGKKQCE